MKIAIIGSREYQNFRKVKDTIFSLMQKFNDLTIVSGGCENGADKYAKKYAIELGCNYIEFNPAHTPKNLYSALSENIPLLSLPTIGVDIKQVPNVGANNN